jgi:phosphatidylglycerol:prolipoprotein diacylglycerol transferase
MNVVFYLPGNLPVYAFPMILAVGGTLGLAWVASQAPFSEARWRVDAGLWAMFGGLLGARAAFVSVSWAYFQDHPWESLEIYRGGLSWPGALLGGVLTVALAAKFLRIPLGKLADAMLPLLASLTVSVWLGCWLDGCAYGPPADTTWGIPSIDEWGVLASRWPTQLVGALLALSLFWFLDRARTWSLTPQWVKRPGNPAGFGILGLSLEMLGLSFWRADPAPGWNHMRLDAWAALAIILLTAASLAIGFIQWRRMEQMPLGNEE